MEKIRNEKSLDLRKSDFIPVKGLVDYFTRNINDHYEDNESAEKKIIYRLGGSTLYNLGLFIPVFVLSAKSLEGLLK